MPKLRYNKTKHQWIFKPHGKPARVVSDSMAQYLRRRGVPVEGKDEVHRARTGLVTHSPKSRPRQEGPRPRPGPTPTPVPTPTPTATPPTPTPTSTPTPTPTSTPIPMPGPTPTPPPTGTPTETPTPPPPKGDGNGGIMDALVRTIGDILGAAETVFNQVGGGDNTSEDPWQAALEALVDAMNGGGGGGAELTPEEIAKIVADTEYTKTLTELLWPEFHLKEDEFAFEKDKWAQQYGLSEREVKELEAAGAFERGPKFEQARREAAAQMAADLLSGRISDVSSRRQATLDLLRTVLPISATEGTAKALGRMFRGVTGGEAFPTTNVPVDLSALDAVDVAGEYSGFLDQSKDYYGLAEGGIVGADDGADVLDIAALIGLDPTIEALKTGIGSLTSLGDLLGYIPGDVANALLAPILPEGTTFTIPGMENGVIKTQAQREAEAAAAQQEWANKFAQQKLEQERALTEAEISARLQAAGMSAEASKEAARIAAEASKYGSEMDYKGRVYASDKSLEGTKYTADVQERLGRLTDQRERAATLASMRSNPTRLFESLYYQAGALPTAGATALDNQLNNSIYNSIYNSAEGSVTMARNRNTPRPGTARIREGDRPPLPRGLPLAPGSESGSGIADLLQSQADWILRQVANGDPNYRATEALQLLRLKDGVLAGNPNALAKAKQAFKVWSTVPGSPMSSPVADESAPTVPGRILPYKPLPLPKDAADLVKAGGPYNTSAPASSFGPNSIVAGDRPPLPPLSSAPAPDPQKAADWLQTQAESILRRVASGDPNVRATDALALLRLKDRWLSGEAPTQELLAEQRGLISDMSRAGKLTLPNTGQLDPRQYLLGGQTSGRPSGPPPIPNDIIGRPRPDEAARIKVGGPYNISDTGPFPGFDRNRFAELATPAPAGGRAGQYDQARREKYMQRLQKRRQLLEGLKNRLGGRTPGRPEPASQLAGGGLVGAFSRAIDRRLGVY